MLSSVPRRVPGPVPPVRHRLELLPSVPEVLALASFQPEDFDLAADLDAIARRAAVRARALSWADGAVVEVTDDDGLVHVTRPVTRGAPSCATRPWSAMTQKPTPWWTGRCAVASGHGR